MVTVVLANAHLDCESHAFSSQLLQFVHTSGTASSGHLGLVTPMHDGQWCIRPPPSLYRSGPASFAEAAELGSCHEHVIYVPSSRQKHILARFSLWTSEWRGERPSGQVENRLNSSSGGYLGLLAYSSWTPLLALQPISLCLLVCDSYSCSHPSTWESRPLRQYVKKTSRPGTTYGRCDLRPAIMNRLIVKAFIISCKHAEHRFH